MMNIAVIGGGYVGLPTAVGFAHLGHRVICCEKNKSKREAAESGRAPFVDEGLDEVMTKVIANGHLRFCAEIAEAVCDADVAFIAVPTNNGEEGLDLLRSVAGEISTHTKNQCVLVIKSTVPPNTCEQLERELHIRVASNPEFLRQGGGLLDFLNPARIVIGADDVQVAAILRKVYEPLIQKGVEYIEISRTDAEMSKLAANMFLASRVALVNELADLCEQNGANINHVTQVLSADDRIGRKYLQSGVGFGGACLPKDGQLLIELAQRNHVSVPATQGIYASNSMRGERIAAHILQYLSKKPVVATWGLAYKANADDMRDSPAVLVVRALCAGGAKVQSCDVGKPMNAPHNMPSSYQFHQDCLEVLNGADALVVLVRHNQYTKVQLADIRRCLRGNHVFDYANLFSHDAVEQVGLVFHSVGIG